MANLLQKAVRTRTTVRNRARYAQTTCSWRATEARKGQYMLLYALKGTFMHHVHDTTCISVSAVFIHVSMCNALTNGNVGPVDALLAGFLLHGCHVEVVMVVVVGEKGEGAAKGRVKVDSSPGFIFWGSWPDRRPGWADFASAFQAPSWVKLEVVFHSYLILKYPQIGIFLANTLPSFPVTSEPENASLCFSLPRLKWGDLRSSCPHSHLS